MREINEGLPMNCKTFMLWGSVPDDIKIDLVEAISSVHSNIFFDEDGKPLKKEVGTYQFAKINFSS
jgi:hypothetical protein